MNNTQRADSENCIKGLSVEELKEEYGVIKISNYEEYKKATIKNSEDIDIISKATDLLERLEGEIEDTDIGDPIEYLIDLHYIKGNTIDEIRKNLSEKGINKASLTIERIFRELLGLKIVNNSDELSLACIEAQERIQKRVIRTLSLGHDKVKNLEYYKSRVKYTLNLVLPSSIKIPNNDTSKIGKSLSEEDLIKRLLYLGEDERSKPILEKYIFQLSKKYGFSLTTLGINRMLEIVLNENGINASSNIKKETIEQLLKDMLKSKGV